MWCNSFHCRESRLPNSSKLPGIRRSDATTYMMNIFSKAFLLSVFRSWSAYAFKLEFPKELHSIRPGTPCSLLTEIKTWYRNTNAHRQNEKMDNQWGSTGSRSGEIKNINSNLSLIESIFKNTFSWSPPPAVSIRPQRPQRGLQLFSSSSAVSSIDDASFCYFCLANIHPATQVTATPLQLHAMPINTCESNLCCCRMPTMVPIGVIRRRPPKNTDQN